MATPVDIVYDVLLDGHPDREDTPWRDPSAAMDEAISLKQANPDKNVSIRVRFEE